jgi:hypothetical protein
MLVEERSSLIEWAVILGQAWEGNEIESKGSGQHEDVAVMEEGGVK